MISVNLVPAARRHAKRRRRHRNVCAAYCGAYGLLLACAVGGVHLLWSGGGAQVGQELASTDADIRRLQRQSDDTRAELATAHATIAANRTVAEQPDWSVILVLLGQTKGEHVVLRSVSVGPPPVPSGTSPQAAAGKSPADVVLEISGIGQNQLAVQQHVLRLEETGLFAKVSLLETGRETFLNGNAIAFRLQCVFDEPRVSKPQNARPTVTSVDAGGIAR